MLSQNEIRQQITNKIIEALEQGVMPWRRPWSISRNTGRPANVVSKRAYSGINPLLLELDAMKKGFHSKWYGTYRQWQPATPPAIVSSKALPGDLLASP